MDRAKALAWHLEQQITCPGCGHPLDETTDPDSEGGWTAEKVRCHACHAQGVRAEATEGDHWGLLYPVHRTERG